MAKSLIKAVVIIVQKVHIMKHQLINVYNAQVTHILTCNKKHALQNVQMVQSITLQ
jgi:hypothetical protein